MTPSPSPECDIVADVTFLPTKDGGRKGAVTVGYRPSHDFGIDGFSDGTHRFVGKEWVAPGESVRSQICLLFPEYFVGQLYVGQRFNVTEGPWVVANATIVDIPNVFLRKPG